VSVVDYGANTLHYCDLNTPVCVIWLRLLASNKMQTVPTKLSCKS
jgi:hypothetical protein